MIKYYLKLALRNSKKHKKFFLVNILSLALGIAIAALLLVHVMYEWSYDSFYKDTGNLFRVNYHVTQDGRQIVHSCRTQSALSWTLPKESQLIEASCRAYYEDCYMYTDNVKLYNQKVVWADKDFLKVFQNDMVIGDRATALENKYSVAISDRIAQIYFGQSDPLGKTIRLNEGMTFTVTAVFKAIPPNSHLRYDFVTSFITFEDFGMPIQGRWDYQFPSTYIRKKNNVSQVQLESMLAEMSRKYLTAEHQGGKDAGYSLTPIKDIYLHSDLEGEFKPMGNARKVTLIGIIALFIMVVAWTNNVNISTSLSFERAKESGIRKLNGAGNKELFLYFITESLFINIVAVLLSLIIIWAAMPFFKALTGGAMVDHFMLQPWFWKSIGAVIVAGVFFAGFLPSIIQASFNPIMVLKNCIGQKTSLNAFRTNLAVFQFTLAILLVVSTILIIKQIDYLQSQDLGMKPSQVLVMRGPATNNTSGDKRYVEFCSFRDELLGSPYFKSATATMNVPGQINRFSNVFVSRNSKKIDKPFNISQADDQYFQTYQVALVEGRNFTGSIENERDKVIVNEKAAFDMGFETAQAIGQKIEYNGAEKQIIGVVRNFHHETLQKEIEPYLYTFEHPGEFGYYPALVSTANVSEAVKLADEIWRKHYPDAQFDYFFLDDYFNAQYTTYKQLGQLAGVGSLFAILIACLGLYSISSYTVNKRIKEIGIRKINGATISEVMTMLNRDFVKWVAIAFVIATPIAYLVMNKWLESFAYKTELSWWIFALAGLLALGIALLTVSWQSWKAATRNPVEALRYE